MTPSQQKQFFDENGYLVVKDLLDPDDLVELRSMADKVLDGELRPEGRDGTSPREDFMIQWEPGVKDEPCLPRRQKIRVVFHLCHTHPSFWKHATRSEILDVVENLLGPDIKLYTDQMFVKPARHGSEVPFHQDSGYWTPLDPPNLLSCWLALDEATVENGCVHVLPGTHKQLLPHHAFEGPQSWGLLPHELDTSVEVPVELPARGAMFHHSCLVHRSFANRSGRGRRGLVSIYLPSTLRFVRPWNFEYGWKLLRGKEFPGCV
ncbi:MAG: phytanoyl-CoA dioxygenase family protein [Armatimonadetes bacterium]|nr:phytanoyl-CoA dioxygenase family protein [Armatimonadota bacterium]